MAQIHGIQARAGAITCRGKRHLLANLPHSERYRGNMPADQGQGHQLNTAQAIQERNSRGTDPPIGGYFGRWTAAKTSPMQSI